MNIVVLVISNLYIFLVLVKSIRIFFILVNFVLL